MLNSRIIGSIVVAILLGLPSSSIAKNTRCDVFMDGGQLVGSCHKELQKNGGFVLVLSDDHEAQLNMNLHALYVNPMPNGKFKVIANYNEGGELWGIFSAVEEETINSLSVKCWKSIKDEFCIIE